MRGIILIILLVAISSTFARDLVVGSSFNNRLVWQHKVEYNAIPFMKRVKEDFYTDPTQHIIRGVIARDLNRDESYATITAGGVGSSFVNLRFKSERGSGLNYQVEIYV